MMYGTKDAISNKRRNPYNAFVRKNKINRAKKSPPAKGFLYSVLLLVHTCDGWLPEEEV